jgi:putative endonuclease
MSANDAVGAYGERVAAQHLTEAGLVVLDRNWRCPSGEIDIIAREGRTLVFCEVKTRRSGAYGHPAEAVGHAKIRRIRQLAVLWLAATGLRPGEIRFDVLSVLPQAAGAAQVEHLRGAF